MQKFEVQTRFIYGWENCWTCDGKPVYFATRSAAVQAMAQAIKDSRDAWREGDLSEPYTSHDFRVMPVEVAEAA